MDDEEGPAEEEENVNKVGEEDGEEDGLLLENNDEDEVALEAARRAQEKAELQLALALRAVPLQLLETPDWGSSSSSDEVTAVACQRGVWGQKTGAVRPRYFEGQS